MAEPLGRAETTALLERHGVRLRRSLGQHFLVEPNVVRRIVAISGVGPGSSVLEIGAGAGTLTRALVESGARVVALEVDQGLIPVLSETVGDTAEVQCVDAAAIDLADVMGDEPWSMVANLPYNVGTPIVLDTLRHVPACERIVVMLQREAVDRLAASPGSKEYGIPSVVVALHGSIEVALRVGAHLFVPRPKVESSVAVINRSTAHPAAERAIELASVAFGQRRKMIRSTLRDLIDPDGFGAIGVAPTARAEELSPSDYLRLAEIS